MFAGELESRDRFQTSDRWKVAECKLGFSEKLHFTSSGSGGLGRFRRVGNAKEDCLRPPFGAPMPCTAGSSMIFYGWL